MTRRCVGDIKLSAFCDNELPEKEYLKVQKHINICPVCKEKVDSLFNLSQRLAALEPIEYSPYFIGNLRQKIREKEDFSGGAIKIQLKRIMVAGLAIAVFAVFIGSYLGKTIYQKNWVIVNQEFDELTGISLLAEFSQDPFDNYYIGFLTKGNTQ